MEKKFRSVKSLFLYLLVLIGSLLLFGESQVFAAELNCGIDVKAPPGAPSYLSWGAWRGPTDQTIKYNDFKLNLFGVDCSGVPNITCWDPASGDWSTWSGLCVGWDDTGVCDISEPGNYSWSTTYPSDRTWYSPSSGNSHCFSAWVRRRVCDGSQSRGYRCDDSTSTHRTQTVSLWDGHFLIYNSYYTYIDNGNGTWTIRYWFGLSGGVKQGEPAGINRDSNSPNGTWCNVGLSQGPGGPELTCDLTKPIGTPVSDYTTNLYIWVGGSRRNGPVSPPPITPTPTVLTPTATLVPTATPTGVLPTVTVTIAPTITPTPTTSTSFSCKILPLNANVAPFGSVSIKAVDATGSSNLRIVNNTWPVPSCGNIGYIPDGRPFATFFAPGNVGAACWQGARAERTVGGVPTGETADCTQGVYTVVEKLYCCGINNTCRICNVGEPPSDSCAGKDVGAWCGGGGPSYDLSCHSLTSVPSPCSGTAGSICTFTAGGGGHGIPYKYRFQSVPNTVSTQALTFMSPNGYYFTLSPNYNTDIMFPFKSPYSSEKFLDKVDVIVKALEDNDGGFTGAPAYAGIFDLDQRTLLAEAKNIIPNGDQNNTLTFDFAVEPKIIPGHQYYLGLISLGSFGTYQGWLTQKTWPGPITKHTRNFWFRDTDGDLGGFPINNPSPYTCLNPGDANSTCEISYKLPMSPTSPSGYKVSFELAAASDITYNCGGVPNGCFSGRATTGCSTLAKTVTVTSPAWWQGANGGNIYGYGGVSSKIFSTATSPYLIDGVSAIAGSGTTIDTNGQDTSLSKWITTNYGIAGLDSPDIYGYSYAFFSNKLKNRFTQTINLGDWKLNDLLANLGGSPNPSVTLVDTDVTISSSGGYDGGTAVVLVNGDLNINRNVTVGDTLALVFIVDGNITIAPTVTQLDGIYFAQRTFTTGAGASQLVGNGAWYVSSSGQFALGRNLGVVNSTTPAEKVNFEPKYLLKLLDLLGRQDYVWQEVPG